MLDRSEREEVRLHQPRCQTLPLSVYEGTWTHSPPLIAMHLLDRFCVSVGFFLKLHATFPNSIWIAWRLWRLVSRRLRWLRSHECATTLGDGSGRSTWTRGGRRPLLKQQAMGGVRSAGLHGTVRWCLMVSLVLRGYIRKARRVMRRDGTMGFSSVMEDERCLLQLIARV